MRRAVAHGDPAGQAEVAVEPRVEQHAAVDLDAELAAAGPAGVGAGLDPQVGAVGVGADQAEAVAGGRSRRAAHATSAAAADQVVAPGAVGQRVGLVEPR